MTKTRRFLVVALLLVALLSGAALTWAFTSLRVYRPLSQGTYQTELLMEYLEDFTLQTAYRLEPDFTYVSGSNMSQADIKQIQNTMLDNTAQGYDVLSKDPNFHYSVRGSDGELHSETLPQQSDAYTITFSIKDGRMRGSGSLDGYGFAPEESASLRESLKTSMNTTLYDDSTGEFSVREYELPEDLAFQFPEDLTFTYSFCKEPVQTPESTFIYSLLADDSIVIYAALLILVITLALELALLFWVPLKEEEQLPVYGAISRGRLEADLFVLGFASLAAAAGFALVASMASEGLLAQLAQASGAKTGRVFTASVLMVIFTACMYFASLPLFWFRQIMTVGPIRYLREKSSFVAWFRRTGTHIGKDVLSRSLSLPIVLNLGAVALIILTGSQGLAVVYGLVLAALMAVLAITVHKGWRTVTDEADRLAAGDFQTEPSGDPTLFAPIYDRLKQVRKGFQRALEEGIESINMRNELISNVSHDLKTPLTGLRSYSELLEITDDPEQMHKYAAKISQYTNRLDSLVTDLFDVSKANAGSLHLEPIHLSLDQLVLQALEEADSAWKKKELEPVISVVPAPVRLDPDKTMRIFENLFSNVAKYALKGTRVFVDIQETPACYVVRIKNTSAAPLNFSADEITERFVRGDKSRHEVGSGLGLAIVKSFTEVQYGRFHIEIDGDLFRAIVVLPKPEDLPPVPEKPAEAAQAAADPSE